MPDNICQQNVNAVPLSASIPEGTDTVLFHLPDGTTVRRLWSVILGNILPDDLEIQVGIDPEGPVPDTYTWTHPALLGKRFRLYRSGRRESRKGDENEQKYAYDASTNTVTVNVAWGIKENIAVEFY